MFKLILPVLQQNNDFIVLKILGAPLTKTDTTIKPTSLINLT